MTEKEYNDILKDILKYIPEQEAQEVLQEVLLQIYETGGEERKLNPEYIRNACYRSFYSKTSPYARKKLREKLTGELIEAVEDEEYEDELPENICKYIDSTDGLSWWEKEALKSKYLEGKSYKELSVEYNIPIHTVQYSVGKAIRKIRQRYESETE